MALQLGEWDVYALKKKMPVSLAHKWLDYYKREPFGARFDNWLTAVQAQQFAMVNSRKGAKVSIDDYMYEHPEIKEENDLNNMMSFFEAR